MSLLSFKLSDFQKKLARTLFVLLVPLVFLFVSLLTLDDYGMSWDEPIHFLRGQAYLNYFLTGEAKFNDSYVGIRSYFKNNSLPFYYWLEKDDGHPPLNGILASFTNYVFFEKLGIISDINAYQIFIILTSAFLVLIVSLFAKETIGLFGALVSAVVLVTYPLFFAESHFNIKDPVQTAFFTATIWSFWKSLQKGSWEWILLSALFSSLALGTKFNILFLPFILVPYLLLRYRVLQTPFRSLLSKIKSVPKSYFLVLVASPFIALGILFASWPFLWQDPMDNFISVINWYKDIGSGRATLGYFLPGGFNAYPVIWFTITTPPFVLLLFVVGVLWACKNGKVKDAVGILWLIWFLVPLVRTSLPETTIYGGIRQIMEFLPALALLSGAGAVFAVEQAHRYLKAPKASVSLIIILAFLPHIFVMQKLHPNENVYFNKLVGGLPGAYKLNVPYWGNSFGNAYWQAIQWLNENAGRNSKIALVQGTTLNIARIQLRSDLAFSNSYWTGINRGGEYLVELTHNDPIRLYPYAWEYIEKFLIPVYEVKVDDVAIAKVWKNDLEHTRPEYKKEEIEYSGNVKLTRENNDLIITLDKQVLLSRVVINYNAKSCNPPTGSFFVSKGGGEWFQEPEPIPNPGQVIDMSKMPANTLIYFFPARNVLALKFSDANANSCVFNDKAIKIVILD